MLLTATALRAEAPHPPIPIQFTLSEPGFVTLVIDRQDGTRVRNLVSETPFPAGQNTAWWDGLDDLGRDPEAAAHAVYHVPGKLVEPGSYSVRGLVRPQIDVLYQMSPYTNGNPAWKTKDRGSEWLTNHTAPNDVLFLPPGVGPERDGKPASKGGQVMIISPVAEGGSGLAWVDLDGHKLWGQSWLGGVWTAGTNLAIDRGKHPVDGVYAYAAASWAGDKYNSFKPELRLHKLVTASGRVKAPRDTRMGTGEDLPVLTPTYEIPLVAGAPADVKTSKDTHERQKYVPSLKGLAVYDGLAVCSFDKADMLLFVDVAAGRTLGTAHVAGVQGIDFDPQGRLVAVVDRKVVRYAINDRSGTPSLGTAEVLVKDGLEDPQRVMVGPDGAIYVSDWGNSNQVKQYDANGTFTRAIGTAGPLALGKYDPSHMNLPAGITLDDRGRLWVAESSKTPKRVSVWNLADGKLADAFYGPSRYGGAGAVDPVNPTRFFYDDEEGGIELKLDYKTGKSVPTSIYYRTPLDQTGLIGKYVGAAPSYPLHSGGRTYLTNAYSGSTTGRRSATLWRLDEDGVARCVAACGNTLDSAGVPLPAFTTDAMKARLPAGTNVDKDPVLFLWSDTNGDGVPQPEEVQFRKAEKPTVRKNTIIGNPSVQNDLSFAVAYFGNMAARFTPTSISAEGVPVYDINKADTLATDVQSPASTGGGQVLVANDGWTVTTTPPKPLAAASLGAVKDGRPMWSYPDPWPGLHASHISPLPDTPGELIGTTRVIGNVIDAPAPSDAGQLWAINGNKGNIYVFTVDGLFVSTLFQDSRRAAWDAPEAITAMNVNQYSLKEECFGPIWTRTDKGDIYLQAGGTCTVLKINGLDRVKRLPTSTINVTRDQLAAARQWSVDTELARRESTKESGDLVVAMPEQKPTVDGKADDWKDAQWVTIDTRDIHIGNWGRKKSTTRAAMALYSDRLYVAVQTDGKDLLRNSGESMQNLFKTGGCIDLMLGTDPSADPNRKAPVAGDLRLLVTRVNNKTTAVLYRPISPDAKDGPVTFGSPLRTVRFDSVQVVSDQVDLASQAVADLKADKDGNTFVSTYEFSVPLKLLGLTPGQPVIGDIGVLRGNGEETFQRSYWQNKASALVSDIPSEAELLPQLWGKIQFEKAK